MTVVPFPVPHKMDRQPAFCILRALPRVMDSYPFFRIIYGKSRVECAVLAAHHVSKILLFHLFLLAAGSKRAQDCLHLGVWSPHGHACRCPRLQTAVLLPLYCIQTIKEMPAALTAAQKAFLFYFHIFSCHSDNRFLLCFSLQSHAPHLRIGQDKQCQPSSQYELWELFVPIGGMNIYCWS